MKIEMQKNPVRVWAVLGFVISILVVVFVLCSYAYREWIYGWGPSPYVSDRPDLTQRPSLETENYIKLRVNKYFQHSGVPITKSKNMQIATMWGPSEILLLRFTLPQQYWKQFVSGKKKLPVAFNKILAQILNDKTSSYGQWLNKHPYNRLAWWPPQKSAYPNIVSYEGKMQWEIRDVGVGTKYYIFINTKENIVYVLGW